MTARQSTPSSENSHSDSGIRKRVCKACDRCRLKKSKCDGAKPCGRCRADNTLCVFGERKKAHDKVYPKGYVEMLEQQQTWLVNGLQELYQRLLKGDGWKGDPLKCESNGQPLTHDLLAQLGALDSSKHEHFEEHADTMQRELWSHNAGHMQRQESTDTSSESPHSPVIPQQFSDPFAAPRTLPQTPSLRIDVPQAQTAVKSEPQTTPNNPSFMHNMPQMVNPEQLHNTQWSTGNLNGYDDIDFISGPYPGMSFDDGSSPLFSSRPMPVNMFPGQFMDNKNEFDDLSQFLVA